jgi:hypothetical protein
MQMFGVGGMRLRLWVCGLQFGVWGLGFGVWGLGFGVKGLGIEPSYPWDSPTLIEAQDPAHPPPIVDA